LVIKKEQSALSIVGQTRSILLYFSDNKDMGSNTSVPLKNKQAIKITFSNHQAKKNFSVTTKKKLLRCIQQTANNWYHVSTQEERSLYYAKVRLTKIEVTREDIKVTGTLTLDKNKVGCKFATQEDYIDSLQSIHWQDNPCHDTTQSTLVLRAPQIEIM
jgi:hypothetical protein